MKHLWPILFFALAACAHQAPLAAPPPQTSVPPIFQKFSKLTLEDPTSIGVGYFLGGFSGLRTLSPSEEGKFRFLTVTSHGPVNSILVAGDRPKRLLPLPGFQPAIVILSADLEKNSLAVEKQIPLIRADGKPMSGVPPIGGIDAASVDGMPLSPDPQGISPKGIARAEDGSYWITDLYSEALLHFSEEGRLLESMRAGNGLPRSLSGGTFAGIAIQGKTGFAILQEPLLVKSTAKMAAPSRIIRLVEIDLENHLTVAQYAYRLQGNTGGFISGLTVTLSGNLLVTEQGLEGRKVYRLNLAKASDLQLLAERVNASLEEMSQTQLKAAEISVVAKSQVANLSRAGLPAGRIGGVDKAGLSLAVITNNEFGLGKPKAAKSEIYLLHLSELKE